MFLCVLQAYQSSSQSLDSDYSGPVGVYSRQSSMDSGPRTARDVRDRKVLSTSSLEANLALENRELTRSQDQQRRSLRPSTSYTSGLSIHRDGNGGGAAQPDPSTMNKAVFLDRRREFEIRAAQENVNPNNSRAYSFGLYFPKKETRVNNSAENLTKSVTIRRSKESVLHSTDSQENISKQSVRTRNVPIEYRHSGSPDQRDRYRSNDTLVQERENSSGRVGSTVRHSFPDSGLQVWASPSRRGVESPYSHHGTPTPDHVPSKRESYCGSVTTSSRQYVPVINESSAAKNQMSASVDSIDPRSNIYHTEQNLRTAYNNGNTSHLVEQQHQTNPPTSSSSRTFILKINEGGDRSVTPTNTQGSNQAGPHSYGAAFALTRSPASAEIEIRQKREPRILVSHRKKQFEERDRNDSVSPVVQSTSSTPHRYKTEIEKITTFRKYDGIQSRLASFERSSSSNGERSRSRSQTPVTSNQKSRQMSQERICSPEPSQQQPNAQYISQGSNQSNYTDSAPIRIYVSQGSAKTSGSPIVEIVPVQSSRAQDLHQCDQSVVYSSHGNLESHDHLDSDGQKPVRKASFLSAVNAPYSRCEYCNGRCVMYALLVHLDIVASYCCSVVFIVYTFYHYKYKATVKHFFWRRKLHSSVQNCYIYIFILQLHLSNELWLS